MATNGESDETGPSEIFRMVGRTGPQQIGVAVQQTTLSEVQRWLTETGFDEDLTARDGRLHAGSSGRDLDPHDVTVSAIYRFEGETDPGDESILFAISSADGDAIGTYTAPYGASVTPDDEQVMQALPRAADVPDEICVEPVHHHVAAVFADRASAEAAVEELRDLGLGSDHLGVAVHGPEHTAFERDEEVVVAKEATAGAAVGASAGVLAGVALSALVFPGVGLLGLGGLFAIGAATGFGGAMLGGYLGIAAGDRAFSAHEELRRTPLQSGEVLVAVLAHDRRDAVEDVMRRHGGRLLSLTSQIP